MASGSHTNEISSGSSSVENSTDNETGTRPKSERWERFQLLKARRQNVATKTSKRLARNMKRSAIAAVNKCVSVSDIKEVLESENVTLTNSAARSKEDGVLEQSDGASGTTQTWKEIQQYINPNPQLECHLSDSVLMSGLKSELDEALKSGRLEEAVDISDRASQIELASKVVRAFDCHRYMTRKRLEEQERKKKPKLKWRYEHKKRWEMKSNM